MPTDKDTEGFEMVYTATLVNEAIIDDIMDIGDEIQNYLEG